MILNIKNSLSNVFIFYKKKQNKKTNQCTSSERAKSTTATMTKDKKEKKVELLIRYSSAS